MPVDSILAALAATSLGDDDYARAADEVRSMVVRLEAADRLARAVVAAESHQPASVFSAAAEFLSLSVEQPAAA